MSLQDHPNIIFDFGGVILNLDYDRTTEAFVKLGVTDFEQSYSQLNQTNLFDEFERGEITPDQFRSGIRTVLNTGVSDALIDEAWNAMLLDLPSERLRLLEKLGQTRRLALLSNTNAIHAEYFEQQMKRQHRIENLDPFFEKVYYSFDVGMRKPEPRIFEFVLQERNFKPEETLFIDDSPQHIEGARRVGLHTYHLRTDQGETILDLF